MITVNVTSETYSNDLTTFRQAKDLSITVFRKFQSLINGILYLNKTYASFNGDIENSESHLKSISLLNEKCSRILTVIERKHMKCALFGRTSNGKSTVINAMLGQKILPSGIGHTTSCFVQIEGTQNDNGFIRKSFHSENRNDEATDQTNSNILPIKSVNELAHALSADKEESNYIIRLFWPQRNCDLLKSDVALLDSPGIDIDPDVDYWIDQYCFDADVFVLVTNAESTITQTEKSFFHTVKKKLSNPNVIILNNRWDICDLEKDFQIETKEQHTNRCLDFLTKELGVYTVDEARKRIFFVSAKEVLEFRTNNKVCSNDNCLASIKERLDSFNLFEKLLQINLCSTALKTKFSSHISQGIDLISVVTDILNNFQDTLSKNLFKALEEKAAKDAASNAIKSNIVKTNNSVNTSISGTHNKIRSNFYEIIRLEIKQLNVIVKSFSSPFSVDSTLLLKYKTELNNFVEHELNGRISSASAVIVKTEMLKFKKYVLNEYGKLLGYDIDRSIVDAVERTLNHDISIPCNTLFSDFKANLSFQWSLSPQSILNKVLEIYSLPNNEIVVHFPEQRYFGLPQLTILQPILSQSVDIIKNKQFLTFCALTIAINRIVGCRITISSALSYGLLYAVERLRWSTTTQEANFKDQYVHYATKQLSTVIEICSRNYCSIVKQELFLNQKSLTRYVENELNRIETELCQTNAYITNLTEYINHLENFKLTAADIRNSLFQFKNDYL